MPTFKKRPIANIGKLPFKLNLTECFIKLVLGFRFRSRSVRFTRISARGGKRLVFFSIFERSPWSISGGSKVKGPVGVEEGGLPRFFGWIFYGFYEVL